MADSSVSEREARIRQKWRDLDVLGQLRKDRKGAHKYFLLDGPPYANNEPHVGHVRNTVYKDLYIRWEFMKGKDVLFQPGFDTHGLPIENMVEKKLNLKSKKDILQMGISKFMATCKESAALNKDLWMQVYDLLGSWYSYKEPYLTFDQSYIQSAWWAFKRLWDKGLVYEGKKPVFWCPKCETALAGYEATDSYKNVTDPAIYVKFKLKDEDASLVVYTTTPWTLPANCAVFVAGDEEYVKVKSVDHGNLILAKERLSLLEELDIKYEVVDSFKGKSLDGKRYESLLDVPSQRVLQDDSAALRVYMSIPILKERISPKVAAKKGIAAGDVYEDFVTVTEGTGLVHCAPGHGKTDNLVGKHFGIPEVSPLDDQCRFTEDVGKFAGLFVKDADHGIADELHKSGRLLHYGTLEHSYPLCWRCKAPLIFRMSDQWFLKIDPIKEQMLSANDNVDWQPDFAHERFSAWVSNADDWNFSRQRYWGIPIPIWKGESGDSVTVGSLKELKGLAVGNIPDDFDLHAASEVKIKHPKTGEVLTRVNDIFDVWFDSGCAPFAALGYPFENKDLFEEHFPVNRINESQDQIRGWFYSLMFCNLAVFDKAPYKAISMPGWVLDSKGEKMSKSVGNVVFAKDAFEEFGADAVRFYYCWDVAPSSTQKFNVDTIKTDVRRFFSIWRNLTQLVVSSGVQFSAQSVVAQELEDRWLLSRLHSTIKQVHSAVESFELHLAGRALQRFLVEDVSRTYVQLVRDRMDDELLPAQLLGHCLWQSAILAAAITPYQSDEVYASLSSLVDGVVLDSVHLERLPQPDIGLVDSSLEGAMSLVGEVIAGVLAARDRAQIGVRWPLQTVIVDTADKGVVKALDLLKGLVLRQTNVRDLKVEPFTKVSFDGKLNYQAVGKALGQRTADAASLFKEKKDEIIAAITGPKGVFKSGDIEFTRDFVNLEKQVDEDYAVGEFKQGSVYAHKVVPRALELEGFARELTRRLQQLRKESGLEKSDRVQAVIVIDEIADELLPFVSEMAKRVGADNLVIKAVGELFGKQSQTSIKGLQASVSLRKL